MSVSTVADRKLYISSPAKGHVVCLTCHQIIQPRSVYFYRVESAGSWFIQCMECHRSHG